MRLPHAIEPDQLKNAAIAALVILGVLVLVAMRVMQKVIARVLMAGILVGAGLFVYSQRDDLDECQKRIRAEITTTSADVRCTCDFLGMEVTVPRCPLAPAPDG